MDTARSWRFKSRGTPSSLYGKTVVFAVLAASLPACRSVELSETSRRSIRTVNVSNEVAEQGSFSGSLPGINTATRGTVWYSTWITAPVGIVYDLIDWSVNKRRRAVAIERKMRDAGAPVGELVRGEFLRGVEGTGVFDPVMRGSADARFVLTVEYGLSDGLGLRGTWKPWLEVEGTLLDQEGNVHWRKRASVSSRDERLPEFFEPFRKPARLRSAFTRAARIVVADLMEHLAES